MLLFYFFCVSKKKNKGGPCIFRDDEDSIHVGETSLIRGSTFKLDLLFVKTKFVVTMTNYTSTSSSSSGLIYSPLTIECATGFSDPLTWFKRRLLLALQKTHHNNPKTSSVFRVSENIKPENLLICLDDGNPDPTENELIQSAQSYAALAFKHKTLRLHIKKNGVK